MQNEKEKFKKDFIRRFVRVDIGCQQKDFDHEREKEILNFEM